MNAIDQDIKELAKRTDRQIAELSGEITKAEDRIESETHFAHTLVGDSKTYRGRSHIGHWNMTDTDALDRVKQGRGIAPYYVDKASQLLADIAAAREVIKKATAAVAPLEALYSQHRWPRFFIVDGGHIHSSQYCAGGTIRATTRVGWLPELSGETEADAVKEHGAILCTHCFPSAPVEWTRGLDKVKDPNMCDCKTRVPGSRINYYPYGAATCAECGTVASITSAGNLRKHKKGETA